MPTPEVHIDPKTARINLATLGTILIVAVAGTFAWADLEAKVDGVVDTLQEVKQALRDNTQAINRESKSLIRLEAKALQHDKDVSAMETKFDSLERRVRTLEGK